LLSHKDAKKLKDWFKLCTDQLQLLGYKDIELIGKGAFGFAFAGTTSGAVSKSISKNDLRSKDAEIIEKPQQQVFKFSRINLPQHVQDRFEEEAYMLKTSRKFPLNTVHCQCVWLLI
jgi:non-specific serine/threonine protein kinase